VPFCIKCSELPCGENTGLISIAFSTNSSIRPIDELCNEKEPNFPYIPGPATGNITLTYYAFNSTSIDKWLGSRCKGQAQASQTNILKYDYCTNKYWYIPSKIHKAQIAGDISESVVSLKQTFFKGINIESQAGAGLSIATQVETWLGAELTYNGVPFGVTVPDLKPWNINVGDARVGFLNSFTLSVDFPNSPAVCAYTFEFPLESS
jgi:hypothetical protein